MAQQTTSGWARVARRHSVLLAVAAALVWLFWASRPQWDPEMRLWKAVGDGALLLLVVTVALGPLARLARPARRLLPWRRETGIWFGLLASLHAVLILNGWARWSLERLFGYEFIPQLGRTARMEPGFGLANLLGLLALAWTIALVATSTDRAVRWLGPKSWKWLHNATQTVFWLVTAHVAYFLFLHYTLSFHRQPPAPDWFRLPFVALAVSVIGLQVAAFVVTTRRQRTRRSERGRGRRSLQRSRA
jgi:sulfoxide reductase heme-binding subunit YedZ